jgi:broad specificity phosphatase PhoE
MRRLMLLRHAKTEHDAPSGHDQDRRLDERGRLDAAALGTWIGRHPPLPDAVLVSTAVRAKQTWEIARDAMKDAVREQVPQPQVELLDELKEAAGPALAVLDDNQRARGSLRGTGEETREIDNPITKKKEVVHTYGWYLRKFIEDTKAQGGTPIVCSLIPRNDWTDGKVRRAGKRWELRRGRDRNHP